jgi:hypothetical protein
MKIYKEVNYDSMEFWSGGQDTVNDLTDEQLKRVWDYLEDTYDEMDETKLNEFFWFDRDFIAELLGFEDYDELLDHNRAL